MTESSSTDGPSQVPDAPALAAVDGTTEAPDLAADGAGGGQYGGGYGHHRRDHNGGLAHKLTFIAGGGFNAPIGNDQPYITWGGNFTIGGGLRFSKNVSALLEYQFMDNKIPGSFINSVALANPTAGITNGNTHINSITASPVIELTPKATNGAYLVGGWGWYHKSTNFNAPIEAFDFYFGYYLTNQTVASFASDQWGGNAGLGIYHRLGGMYGESKTRIFAEARYTFLHTPPITETNGLGRTELLPVTLGLRF